MDLRQFKFIQIWERHLLGLSSRPSTCPPERKDLRHGSGRIVVGLADTSLLGIPTLTAGMSKIVRIRREGVARERRGLVLPWRDS